eukprot:jgi/Astpho2/595/Aster-x0941
MLRTACILAALCLLSHASAAGRTLLAPANGPPTTSAEGTSILNAILAKKVGVTSFGEKTEQPNPGPNGVGPGQLSSQPTAAASSSSLSIVFQCRAVGQQIWTTGANGQYANTADQADLWCGPGTAKIPIKHFFSDPSTGNEEFIGGSPTFTAVDGSGTVVASKLTGGSVVAPRSGDGGFGSVGDLLLGSTSSRGTFSDITYIVRNNELGGQLPSGLTPLVNSNANVQNFAPTGAEGVPNAPLYIPYQADYTFIAGSTQPGLPPGGTG